MQRVRKLGPALIDGGWLLAVDQRAAFP